jgi:hypothetical protein
MTVSAVHMPATPFEATGLPSVGTKIAPGEVIKVHLIFKSSTPGEFNQSVGLTTEAGETKIAVSASANTEPSPEPNPTPSPEPGPTPARTTSTTASGATVQFAPVSLSTFPNPLGNAFAPEDPPPPRPSTHGHRRRNWLITYTLSAAAQVQIAIYRRVVSYRCHRGQRGASTCVHYLPTTIKLNVVGHAASNVLAVNLAHLSAGHYRLAATPIARSGAAGVTRYVSFKTG